MEKSVSIINFRFCNSKSFLLIIICMIINLNTYDFKSHKIEGNFLNYMMENSTIVTEMKPPNNNEKYQSFLETALSGFTVLILAEIGDKTFFLVMIFSATNSFLTTFLTSSSVMLLWNLICLIIGSSIPNYFFKGFLDIVGMVIFLIFGLLMIYSAYHMENHTLKVSLNETKSELSRKSLTRKSFKSNMTESDSIKEPLLNNDYFKDPNEAENLEDEGFHSKWAFISTLALAEFGDKTQISTIILGSTHHFYAVLLGTSLARIVGIIIAIIFGKIIAHNITTKQVTYLGGLIFIIFSLVYAIKIFWTS